MKSLRRITTAKLTWPYMLLGTISHIEYDNVPLE